MATGPLPSPPTASSEALFHIRDSSNSPCVSCQPSPPPSFLGQPSPSSHSSSKSGIIVGSLALSTALVCQAKNFTSISPSQSCPFLFVLCYTCSHMSLQIIMLAFSMISLTSVLPFFHSTCIIPSDQL